MSEITWDLMRGTDTMFACDACGAVVLIKHIGLHQDWHDSLAAPYRIPGRAGAVAKLTKAAWSALLPVLKAYTAASRRPPLYAYTALCGHDNCRRLVGKDKQGTWVHVHSGRDQCHPHADPARVAYPEPRKEAGEDADVQR